MAERMEIPVDFMTERAVANIQRLIEALRISQQETRELAAASTALDNQLRGVGTTATATTKGLGGVSAASSSATQSVARFGTTLGGAGNATTNTAGNIAGLGNAMNTAGTATANATRNVAGLGSSLASTRTATNLLSSEVGSWIARYVGIEAIIRTYEQIATKAKEAAAAHRELAEMRMDNAPLANELINNLPAGTTQQQVDSLTLRVMRDSRAGYAGANNALIATQSAGKDVLTPEGERYASVMARIQRMTDYDRPSMEAFGKFAQESGMDTAEGLEDLAGKMLAVQGVSQGSNPATFMKGALRASTDPMAKGVSPELPVSMYSALLTGKTTERDAAHAVRQIFTLAQGTNEKGRDFLASRARALGVTKITDEDVARHLPEAEASRLADDERSLSLRDQEGRSKARTPVDREQHQISMREARRDFEARRMKVFSEAVTAAEREALSKVSLEQRLRDVVIPTFSTQDPAMRQEIVESTGGMFTRNDAAFNLSTPEAQERMGLAQRTWRGANRGELQTRLRNFDKTDQGIITGDKADFERQALEGKVAQPGADVTMTSLLDRARNQYTLRAAKGDFETSAAERASVEQLQSFVYNTESTNLNKIGWELLEDDAIKFSIEMEQAGDSAGVREARNAIAAIRRQRASVANLDPATSGRNLQNAAAAFGTARHTIRQSSQTRGTMLQQQRDMGLPVPAPVRDWGPGRTDAPGHRLGGGGPGITYNVNIGQYFGHDMDMPDDLPGPRQALG